jgi:dihydroflavonol-4-reductase
MKKIDKKKPVMVTGATGYVAGWIVKKLLDEGTTVHAAVRNPENKEKLKYLNEAAANSTGKIKYFKTDLLESGSFDEATAGCEVIFHTASPFKLDVKDPQKDLVDPALIGTQNVLATANKVKTVKRVVLTSSVVAVLGDARDSLMFSDGGVTEENWNTTSTLSHQPYNYSKTLAEKEAWEMADAQDRWDLVVINPSFVMGPGISPVNTSASFDLIKQMGDGTLKSGVPAFYFGMVDVRDIADAHLKAAFTPEAEGRHILSASELSMLQLANILREKYGDDYKFPKKVLPKFMIWLMAPLVGIKRKMVSNNYNYRWNLDNTKSKEKLGIEYLPVEKSITEFFRQMIDNGVFDKK